MHCYLVFSISENEAKVKGMNELALGNRDRL